MKVEWSKSARADAREIVSYVAQDNPAAAGRWVKELKALTSRLAQFPGIGHEVYGKAAEDLREFRHGK